MHLKLTHLAVRHPLAFSGSAWALQGINLGLEAGEQVAIIGPSGAGKTTLLHTLALALPPSEGSLEWDSGLAPGGHAHAQKPIDPWTLPHAELQRLRGHLFLAPQVPPLPPRQRVVTSVLAGRLPQWDLWASIKSLFYPSDLVPAQAALGRFDLAEKLFDRVDRLSGGERQRVGLARALLALATADANSHPSGARLLLVDEPLSALDPTRAAQALQVLTTEAQSRGVTLVASLHHVELALAYFPRVVGLRAGQLVFDLPTTAVTPQHLRELYAHHLDELHTPAPTLGTLAEEPQAPVVMHCR